MARFSVFFITIPMFNYFIGKIVITLCRFRRIRIRGKREFWVRSASVVPKSNIELMTQCYIWVQAASIIPKCNNWLITHCYIWVSSASVAPKCNNVSLIYCYIWVRLMPIKPKLHVGVSLVWNNRTQSLYGFFHVMKFNFFQ